MSDEFNDPELKKAVRRAWSGESAPAELRARIATSMANMPLSRWTDSFSWPAIAGLAAILLLGLSFLANDPGQEQNQSLPAFIASAIMQTHDRCCLVNDHHFVPRQYAGDMADTGRWLSTRTHIAVLAVDMGQGWGYCGAGPCRVSGIPSGHLLFKRGGDDLSIFSLPASQFGLPAKDQEFVVDAYKNHLYAAFTKNGGLYCVMSRDPSGQFGPQKIEAVRQSLMKDFRTDTFTANGSVPAPSDMAILLEDGGD